MNEMQAPIFNVNVIEPMRGVVDISIFDINHEIWSMTIISYKSLEKR